MGPQKAMTPPNGPLKKQLVFKRELLQQNLEVPLSWRTPKQTPQFLSTQTRKVFFSLVVEI